MLEVVLVHPEIPPNAGNVIRLAANTGARLHFVEPLGFTMEDRQMKRAGLDYHEYAEVKLHRDWHACAGHFSGRRMFALTTKATASVYDNRFMENDVLVFGSESAGLPQQILDSFGESRRLRLPMRPGNRSLNLSNAVAVTVFEAWRQLGFAGT